MAKIRVIQFGLGPIGAGVARVIAGRSDFQIVGAVDIDKAKVGQDVGEITIGIIAGVLFLGIISTAIAMFLWNYAFAKLPAAVASLTFFAQPVVGALLGWFFLSEKITPLFITGGVLIGIGILISASEG